MPGDTWFQTLVTLPARDRGFHLVTHEIVAGLPELKGIRVGLAHLFIQHTSASLTVSENADPTVRDDFESQFNVLVPEGAPFFRHTLEGPDDMPAHIKNAILGSSLTLPVRDGTFVLGTWQGIYLCEHRNHGGPRSVVITVHGKVAVADADSASDAGRDAADET